ncbi:M28 family peptidase [Candidatus Woesearchaeota archaeon]|nr:M28 family peptidase [Candidatus Woesearchaeota archaeon]
MTSLHLLQQLCNTIGPSGAEGNVRKMIAKEIKPYVDAISVDKFGNLIAHKVKSVQDNGQLTFSVIGGVDPVVLIGHTASVLNSKNQVACKGVITFEELHEDLEVTGMPKLGDLYIDTGLKKEELKALDIGAGSYVVFTHHFTTLGSEKIISGKALDDRIGCYILIEVAKRLKSVNQDVYYVFTVQEEIGLYGSKVSAYNVEPDWGIAIDVTNADDSSEKNLINMGKGPVVVLMDAEIITTRCIDEWLKAVAKKHKIPLQLKVDEVGTTDATQIMLHKEGTPSSVLGVAVRNLHSSVGIAHTDDIANAIQLVYELLKNPPNICIE